MSQYQFEFNVGSEKRLRPVPLFVEAIRQQADLFIFKFPDALFMVRDTEENLDKIELSLRFNGFVHDAMTAQMVESKSLGDT